MKRLLIGVIVVMLLAPVLAYAGGYPSSEGTKTNPAANTIMADTGGLLAGTYSIAVMCEQSTAAMYAVEYRDTTDTTTLWSQPFQGNATDTKLLTFGFAIAYTESIRVRLTSAIALGTATCSVVVND